MKNNKARKKYTKPAMKFYREGWNPLKYIGQFSRGVKYIYQRARYGYCDKDVFNMDQHLSALIGDMLNELADITHGYPVLVENDEIVDQGDEAVDQGIDSWKESLRKLAIHFYNTLGEYESEPRIKSKEAFEEYKNCLGEDYFDFWNKAYMDGTREETEETKETEEDKDLEKKWLNAENEADRFMDEEKDRALAELKEIYFHLWD